MPINIFIFQCLVAFETRPKKGEQFATDWRIAMSPSAYRTPCTCSVTALGCKGCTVMLVLVACTHVPNGTMLTGSIMIVEHTCHSDPQCSGGVEVVPRLLLLGLHDGLPVIIIRKQTIAPASHFIVLYGIEGNNSIECSTRTNYHGILWS
jgi:hypothetical protein